MEKIKCDRAAVLGAAMVVVRTVIPLLVRAFEWNPD